MCAEGLVLHSRSPLCTMYRLLLWQHARCCTSSRDTMCEQVVLMGLAESYRNNGSAPGVDGLDKLYPGTPDSASVSSTVITSRICWQASAHMPSCSLKCSEPYA